MSVNPAPAIQAGIPASTGPGPAQPIADKLASGFKDVLHRLDKSEAFVDRVVRLASSGRDFSPAELIAIQAGVYRYSQELEALSKLVDATTGCVRRTLEAAG